MFVFYAVVFLLIQIAFSSSNSFANNNESANSRGRVAFVLTLAGPKKLAPYVEWSCRTFGLSSSFFDLLIFHEENIALRQIRCPSNVKFISLGENGLSNIIVQEILQGKEISDTSKRELLSITNEIIVRCPRYLVEVKPMFGTLFGKYLKDYSHWSYSDPDIIWGNLENWIDQDDLSQFKYITVAKNMDSGRLFLRGQATFISIKKYLLNLLCSFETQLTLHKNEEDVNNLWKQLPYFNADIYIRRMGKAFQMIKERKSSDDIFYTNFYSAEGWYSQLVFRSPQATVKIIGRGFDDFFREPVILNQGRLNRCSLDNQLSLCIDAARNLPQNVSVYSLPPIKVLSYT